MELLSALSVGGLVVVALLIATRLFSIWLRTRALPELLLSLMLVGVTVLGYPLSLGCMLVPATELLAIHLVLPVAINGGYVCLLLFTLTTFRPTERWARALAGATGTTLIAGGALYIAEALGDDPRPLLEMHDLGLMTIPGVGIGYGWTTIEALLYHRKLRLRLKLGMGDVVVANRVLLWGLMTGAAGLALVISVLALVLDRLLDPLTVILMTALGLVHVGSLVLALAPPAWYRNWVRAGAAGADGATTAEA